MGRNIRKKTTRISKKREKPLPKSKTKAKTSVDKNKGSNVSHFMGHVITDVPIDEDYHHGSHASIKHLYKKYKDGENILRFFTKILKNLPKKIVYFAKAPIIKGWGSHFDKNHFIIDLDWNNIMITEDLPKELIKFLENNKGKYTGSQGTWPMAHAAMYHTISSGLTNEINKGIKLKYRFICVRIALKRTKPKLSHSNIVVYDTKNKIVELFEPHGHSPYITKTRDHYKEVTSILKKYNKHMFPKYKFMELIKFNKKDMKKIKNFYLSLKNKKIDFTSFLNSLIQSKVIKMNFQETNKFWFEIDTIKDLNALKGTNYKI